MGIFMHAVIMSHMSGSSSTVKGTLNLVDIKLTIKRIEKKQQRDWVFISIASSLSTQVYT